LLGEFLLLALGGWFFLFGDLHLAHKLFFLQAFQILLLLLVDFWVLVDLDAVEGDGVIIALALPFLLHYQVLKLPKVLKILDHRRGTIQELNEISVLKVLLVLGR